MEKLYLSLTNWVICNPDQATTLIIVMGVLLVFYFLRNTIGN